jgi:hypothetical protein
VGKSAAAAAAAASHAEAEGAAIAAAADEAINAANAAADEIAAEAAASAAAAAMAAAATLGGGGATIELGTEVEARYKGKSKWYKGVVEAVNADGSFAVLYDDGDVEPNVSPDLVCKARALPGAFAAGATVEARYKGKSKWYRGQVQLDNGDGTYAIRYEDGDEESHVYLIRCAPLA